MCYSDKISVRKYILVSCEKGENGAARVPLGEEEDIKGPTKGEGERLRGLLRGRYGNMSLSRVRGIREDNSLFEKKQRWKNPSEMRRAHCWDL